MLLSQMLCSLAVKENENKISGSETKSTETVHTDVVCRTGHHLQCLLLDDALLLQLIALFLEVLQL